MRKDKAGNILYRKAMVKVIFPDGIFPDRTFVQHAGPKQGFSPDNIFEMLDQIATRLDELYPWWDFKSSELTPVGSTARYVFTFDSYRTASRQPTERSAPEPETTPNPTAEIASEVSATLQPAPSQELVTGE